ncbi:MAG: hypothetical protein AAGG47_03735, partial [Pseudomonadota bacterium]
MLEAPEARAAGAGEGGPVIDPVIDPLIDPPSRPHPDRRTLRNRRQSVRSSSCVSKISITSP